MSFLLALLALQSAPTQVVPAAGDIGVIANKLRGFRSEWRLHKGKFTCKTKTSTGEKAIDAIGCKAIETCISPIAPQIQTIADSNLGRATKDRSINALMQSAMPCMDQTRHDGIAALAAQRAGG